MKRRVFSLALCMCLILGVFPYTPAIALSDNQGIGNTDQNILNGGIMVNDGDDFYYSDKGIFRDSPSGAQLISEEFGKNLNISNGYIYYTLSQGIVRRASLSGGEAETIYTHSGEISQLYVTASGMVFLSQGSVWEFFNQSATAQKLDTPEKVRGLIVTEFGNIYLTGDIFNYDIYVNHTRILSGVSTCYTQSGYLVLNIGTKDYQAELASVFQGKIGSIDDLEPFSLFDEVGLAALFGSESDEPRVCEMCEENANDPGLRDALLEKSVSGMNIDGENDVPGEEDVPEVKPIPLVSQGQRNIVLRARQMHEIRWTPLFDRHQWGHRGVFSAGTTYTGLPYGQPVHTGYVGWSISLDGYLDAVNTSGSKFYSDYSQYNKIAPYYSNDCSAFASTAWGLSSRLTTYSLPQVAEKVETQSIYSIQLGDILNHSTSHVVLVSAVRYDDLGSISSIDILEQTPVITKHTRYGESGSKTLSDLQQSYLNSGYVLYRYPGRDEVSYTHNCAVPIDGDYCSNCRAASPIAFTSSFAGGKTVSLSHSEAGAEIYYTLDGSTPTPYSNRYSSPLTFTDSGKIKAMAVTDMFSTSFLLDYDVIIPQAEAPEAEVTSGISYGNLVSQGSMVTLSSKTPDASIYYTLDGSVPDESSAKYASPITINTDTTIKTIAVANGTKVSSPVSYTFTIANLHSINATAGKGGSISPSGDVGVIESSSKSFEITPDSGYKIDKVIVDGSSHGDISSYTFTDISRSHEISVSFKEINNLPFKDVSENSWYFPAVNSVYRNGYFSGTSATTFSPDTSMTRGMFITVLGRMAGVPSGLKSGIGIVAGNGVNLRSESNTDCKVLAVCNNNQVVQVLGKSGDWYKVSKGSITGYIREDLIKVYSNTFVDLPSNQYYSHYVEWAYLTGIAGGTSSNTFSPNAEITREQMCVLLYNYAQKNGISLPVVNYKELFSDDASISDYAKNAVYSLQQAGIISGSGGSFTPKSNASRSQVAQIFVNFNEAVGG